MTESGRSYVPRKLKCTFQDLNAPVTELGKPAVASDSNWNGEHSARLEPQDRKKPNNKPRALLRRGWAHIPDWSLCVADGMLMPAFAGGFSQQKTGLFFPGQTDPFSMAGT